MNWKLLKEYPELETEIFLKLGKWLEEYLWEHYRYSVSAETLAEQICKFLERKD